jgi:spermidine synthase
MIAWIKYGAALAPDGTELVLWQRGDELVVRADGIDLMSTRLHGSEEVLAEHGLEGLTAPGAHRAAPSVLIGGLGFGFTLRAALALLPPDARVVVAELIPEMVAWVRGPVGAGALLDDPRVTIDARDVAEVLRGSPGAFDAILLDVDNGPRALTQAANRWLYARAGIEATRRALRPRGRLAVWSAAEDPGFEVLLGRAGFSARSIGVRAHRAGPAASGAPGRGARHVIFVADRPPS